MNKTHALMLCAALALGGCGGGGDDAPPVTEQVPAEVGTSVSSLVSYLKALIVAAADMLEPVDVSAVAPATDDTAEPTSVD